VIGVQHIVTITGERDWTDEETICRVLDRALKTWLDRIDASLTPRGPSVSVMDYPAQDRAAFVLRHGANNSGADAIANRWGIARGVTVERFHADWRLPTGGVDYSAGPRRNAKMAAAEPPADRAYAFWSGKTTLRRGREVSGTRDCIGVLAAVGIEVHVIPPSIKEQST